VAQATTQMQANQNLLIQLWAEKSRVAVEWRVKNMQHGEKSAKSLHVTLAWNLIKYFIEKSVDLVTYISITNVLVPTCWFSNHCQNLELAKFLPIFFQAKNWKYLNLLQN